MGTWGGAAWENDSALDWIHQCLDEDRMVRELSLALSEEKSESFDNIVDQWRAGAEMLIKLEPIVMLFDDRFLYSLALERLKSIDLDNPYGVEKLTESWISDEKGQEFLKAIQFDVTQQIKTLENICSTLGEMDEQLRADEAEIAQ